MEISTDSRFLESLEYIAQKFKRPVRKVGDRYQVNLPNNIDQGKYFDAIIYQIVTTMKKKYIHDKIQIKDETLIRILTNYDKKTDIIIATALISISPMILLDGLFDFRIIKLKSRWDEVIKLVNDNHLKLVQKELFDDLLRFLIQNMDYKTKEAHIICIDQKATVCNDKFEPFAKPDANIINTLIDVAPKQIFVHIDPNMEASLIKKIESLFPNCVCIEYGIML